MSHPMRACPHCATGRLVWEPDCGRRPFEPETGFFALRCFACGAIVAYVERDGMVTTVPRAPETPLPPPVPLRSPSGLRPEPGRLEPGQRRCRSCCRVLPLETTFWRRGAHRVGFCEVCKDCERVQEHPPLPSAP